MKQVLRSSYFSCSSPPGFKIQPRPGFHRGLGPGRPPLDPDHQELVPGGADRPQRRLQLREQEPELERPSRPAADYRQHPEKRKKTILLLFLMEAAVR